MNDTKKHKAGFTLIELLISIGLGTIIFGALSVVLISTVTLQDSVLRKQEVIHNVWIITETMTRYMRLAMPYNKDDSFQNANCVSNNSYFGGLDNLSNKEKDDVPSVSSDSYIQFLSPLEQDKCIRFFLKDGVVMTGIKPQGGEWVDDPLTSQEDVGIALLEFAQGGISTKHGSLPSVTIFVHAGIENNSSPQTSYDHLVKTQVLVAIRTFDPVASGSAPFSSRRLVRWSGNGCAEYDPNRIKRLYRLAFNTTANAVLPDISCTTDLECPIETTCKEGQCVSPTCKLDGSDGLVCPSHTRCEIDDEALAGSPNGVCATECHNGFIIEFIHGSDPDNLSHIRFPVDYPKPGEESKDCQYFNFFGIQDYQAARLVMPEQSKYGRTDSPSSVVCSYDTNDISDWIRDPSLYDEQYWVPYVGS